MKVELLITKDRVPYLVDRLGRHKVTVVDDGDETFDKVIFEVHDHFDVLSVFHAGIECGSKSLVKELRQSIFDNAGK